MYNACRYIYSVDSRPLKVNRRLTMKYTKQQRLDIGKRIYDGEISRYQAAELYEISDQTARDYMRLYRDVNGLPSKRCERTEMHIASTDPAPAALEGYESMTKEDLIKELIKARINEARLKKGYEVKGDGSVIQYSSKNIK